MYKSKQHEDLLGSNPIFASLSHEERQEVLRHFKVVTKQKNNTLFSQGETSDAAYILITGRMFATLLMADGSIKEVGYIEPGEIVGELGVLSNEPRTLTVTAIEDSKLLKLPAKDFLEVANQYPSVMFAALRPVIARSRNLIQILSNKKLRKHIIIIAANEKVNIEGFAETLCHYAKKYKNILCFSDAEENLKGKHKTITEMRNQIHILTNKQKKARRYIYFLNSATDSLAKFAFNRVDIVYVLGDSRVSAKLNDDLKHRLQTLIKRKNIHPRLIMLQDSDATIPKNTSQWLQLIEFKLHHQVRYQNKNDHLRMLRFIRERAVGVVLGGGGTRGWGHLGVIKAMRKNKTPIDIIGGTSVGALIAANYALNHSYNQAYQIFYDMSVASQGTISWHGWTWPLISLYSSERYTKALIDAYDDVTFEEMWLPCFCITSNLTKGMQEVHTRGLVWKAIRASSAIPGVIPPMMLGNDIHLDGGLLNNLPVDIMRDFIGRDSKVIAVEISNQSHKKVNYRFPPIFTIKNAVMQKLGIAKYKLPTLVDIFLKGIFLGSNLKSKQNSLLADVFISIDLQHYKLLSDNVDNSSTMINLGYKSYFKTLKNGS